MKENLPFLSGGRRVSQPKIHQSFLRPAGRIRHSRIPAILVVAALSLGSLDFSHGKRLNKRDLRKAGFVGVYRGIDRGRLGLWNVGLGVYNESGVFQQLRQRVPFPRRSVVGAPTGTNGFFLTYANPRGNDRRVKFTGVYSGISFNSFYGLNMRGSGSRTILISKKGKRNPRFVMRVRDSFNEREATNGALYTYWRVSGSAKKR